MVYTDKTEAMTVGMAYRSNQIESDSILILDSDIIFLNSVNYFGVRLDHTLSLSERINDIWVPHMYLRQIRCIRAYLSKKATYSLVNSIIFSRFDVSRQNVLITTTNPLPIFEKRLGSWYLQFSFRCNNYTLPAQVNPSPSKPSLQEHS